MRSKQTVAELAREAGVLPDEILLNLWDLGFDDILHHSDKISSTALTQVRTKLNLPSLRDLESTSYWMSLFRISKKELEKKLFEIGFKLGNKTRGIPARAIKFLKKEAEQKGINLTQVFQNDLPLATRKSVEEVSNKHFEWIPIGRSIDIRYLSVVEVLEIYYSLVKDFRDSDDPIYPPGLRDVGLFESAVYRPHTSLGETLKYPTIETAVASLLYGLVHDHAFHNGNKRTALVAMLVFLDVNGFVLTSEEDEVFQFVTKLTQHSLVKMRKYEADKEIFAISQWLCTNVRPIEVGDRAISWRKLHRILLDFGCNFETNKNRLDISRAFLKKNYLGFSSNVKLTTHISVINENREVGIPTIKKLRKDLMLDEKNGFDSHAFYRAGTPQPSEFIVRYSKTLKRLAKL